MNREDKFKKATENEAHKTMFRPTNPILKDGSVNNSGFSADGTLISASAVPIGVPENRTDMPDRYLASLWNQSVSTTPDCLVSSTTS